MRLIYAKNYEEASLKTADMIAAQIIIKPTSVIGLATGSTPEGTYKELINKYKAGTISFKEVTSVNLDEYLGLDKTDPQSYFYFMGEKLHNHTDILKENVNLPNGAAGNPEAECIRYEMLVDDLGGVDLQLLGIGANGHVGFNEPAETVSNYTYCVDLTQSTIDANKRFFEKEEDVPKKALTMGIGTIMRAKKIVMLITGEGKADILEQAIFGPITTMVPASLMRLHPDFTVIADEGALSKVKHLI